MEESVDWKKSLYSPQCPKVQLSKCRGSNLWMPDGKKKNGLLLSRGADLLPRGNWLATIWYRTLDWFRGGHAAHQMLLDTSYHQHQPIWQMVREDGSCKPATSGNAWFCLFVVVHLLVAKCWKNSKDLAKEAWCKEVWKLTVLTAIITYKYKKT